MKNYVYTIIWIQACIESCNTLEQLNNSLNLIKNFYKVFQHPYFYKHLIDVYSEQKIIIIHEKNN